MIRISRLLPLLAVAAVLLLLLPAYAQYGASLQGTVTDKTGAVVPGATVTVTNQSTGISAVTTTTDAGFYRVAALPPGTYTVKVEAASFATKSVSGVAVVAEAARGLDLMLNPAGATETVTVTGEAPPVQTENASISGAITSTEITRLAQYGRSPYDLVKLAPGVFGDGALEGNGTASWFPNSPGPDKNSTSIFAVENQIQVSAHGQRLTANSVTIDGTSVNDLTWAGAAIITPNQESVQEMNVVSNAYSAEDGRSMGAQIKVISKYGTNQFHGSAFFKYDEPGLNAYNSWGGPTPTSTTTRVNQKLRQFGGSVGGPVFKDKLFFFFSYEGNRTASSYLGTPVYVLTPQLTSWITQNRANTLIGREVSAAGATPRIGQVLPALCSDLNGQWPSYTGCTSYGNAGLDIGSPTLAYGQYVPTWNTTPCPTGQNCTITANTTGGGLDGIPDLQLVRILNPSTSHGNQYNGRVDYARGKDLFAFSTYYTPRNDITSNGVAPNMDVAFQPRNAYVALLWNRTFSATLLNEFRVNATRLLVNQYGSNRNSLWGLPALQIEQLPFDRIKYGIPAGDNSPFQAAQNQFEFRDSLSKILGRHGLKIGGLLALNQDNNNTMFGSQRPTFVFHGVWNFVNGAPIYEGINADPVTGAPTDTHKYYRQRDWALFFQDDMKLRPNLTLNLGLRYEYFAPLSEKYNKLSNLILSTGANPLNGATVQAGLTSLYQPDRNNFAPRIGFAWSPAKFNNKTVVRGGFGVAYNRLGDNELGIARVNPPYVYRYGICCAASTLDLIANGWMQPAFANGAINYNVIGTNYNSIFNYGANPVLGNNINTATNLPINAASGIEIWGAPQNDRTPYSFIYSLDVQQELPAKFTATLGYQGSQTRKLLRIVNIMKIAPQNTTQVGNAYFPTTDSNANYNAMNLTVNRTFTNGLLFMGKYTWSKSIDQGTGEGAGSTRDPFWPANHIYDTGPSDFDAKHNLLLTAIWDVPFMKGRQDFVGRLLGGWHIDPQFQFHSGFPWSPVAYGPNCLNTHGGNICPNLPTAYLGHANLDASNSTFMDNGGMFPAMYSGGTFNSNGWQTYFSTACPTSAQDALGNCYPGIHRNSFRGPRYRQVNLSLGKTTKFAVAGHEGTALDIRANFFNLFNNLNLAPFAPASSSTIITDPHFGQATAALAGRVVELQMRLSF